MYIGGTDSTAYHHLVSEIIDNSMDEVVAGHSKEIIVKLINKNTIYISDDGRGIPINTPKKEVSAGIVMTSLHAGENLKMVLIIHQQDFMVLVYQWLML